VSRFPVLLHTAIDARDCRALGEFYRQLLGLRYRDGEEPPTDGSPDDADWLVLVDDDGNVHGIGRATPGISHKLRRAVLLRDARCRVAGCGRRRGLEVHHLVPRSWDGTDEISNLAAVCPAHHRLLIPHGLLALVGNPNLPDGLELVTASRGPP
jgi:hypothetical protein